MGRERAQNARQAFYRQVRRRNKKRHVLLTLFLTLILTLTLTLTLTRCVVGTPPKSPDCMSSQLPRSEVPSSASWLDLRSDSLHV